jgi:hypothetical protein
VAHTASAMNNDTQAELEKVRAEHEQLLKDLKELTDNWDHDRRYLDWVNPELSSELLPWTIENLMFVSIAGELERTAKTEEEKRTAYVARQIAVYIYTLHEINSAMSYLLGTFVGHWGKDHPRKTHKDRPNYGERWTSRLGLNIDTRLNKKNKSP